MIFAGAAGFDVAKVDERVISKNDPRNRLPIPIERFSLALATRRPDQTAAKVMSCAKEKTHRPKGPVG
jgi:hypothetical protein